MNKEKKQKEYERSFERARDGEVIPLCVCVRLTRLCNLSCDYCSELRDLGEDINFEEWRKSINIIYNLGNRDITITGGEPFIKDFLIELVRLSSAKNMYVSVATNGNLLTPEILGSIDNAGLDFLCISIDRIHTEGDVFGKDITPQLKSNLDYIASGDFNFSTIVSTVVTERNFDQLESMVEYFTSRGIYQKFMLMMPNYTNPSKTSDLGVKSIDSLESSLIRIKDMAKQGFLIVDGPQVLDNMVAYLKGTYHFNCKGGKYELSLNNDGRLVLCPDGTISQTHIFDIRDAQDYTAFLSRNEGYSKRCNGCFWTCKQRLYDKLLNQATPQNE